MSPFCLEAIIFLLDLVAGTVSFLLRVTFHKEIKVLLLHQSYCVGKGEWEVGLGAGRVVCGTSLMLSL